MKRYARNRATLLAMAVLLVACCSQRQDNGPPSVRSTAEAAPPSEADMRAAHLLSLSNNGAFNPASDRYQQAVACVDGIGAIAAQPAAASVLNDQQKRMLGQAKGIYQRKAMDAGHKTAAQVARDVQAREAASDDLRQRLFAGLSCLRQLG